MEPHPQTPPAPPATDRPMPVMDVVAAPPESAKPHESAAPADKPTGKPAEPPKPAPAPKPAKPSQPKSPGSGVGLAIFATVIIVLGLAVLATYAYIQTHK